MTITFNTVDVETANRDRATICQIGIVHVQDSRIIDQWKSLINPESWFSELNISIHGISKRDVKDKPIFPDVQDEIRKRFRDSVIISHSSFDKVALNRAFEKYDLKPLQAHWLDSLKIARCVWPEFKKDGGYGLSNITKKLGISFTHHDALEDALAAAKIVLKACELQETDIQGLLKIVNQPISPRRNLPKSIEVNPNGELYGETIVFTGKLERISRREAFELAAKNGAKPVNNVTKEVTILVAGTQDMQQLRSHEKSSKLRTAEEYMGRGSDIQIITENDFYELIGLNKE